MVHRWVFTALLVLLTAANGAAVRPSADAIPQLPTAPFALVENERVVSLAEDGQDIHLGLGDNLVLALGTDYTWTVLTRDSQVLEYVPSALTVSGCQGQYQARHAGLTQLVAFGAPTCLQSRPSNELFARQFVVSIVVQ